MNYAVAIPLQAAYLCLDCEHVVNRITTCPKCGSAHLASVARFLNRCPETPSSGEARR